VDEARRFLELIRREVGASDVRIEMGLEPPSSRLAFAPIGNDVFVVVHFDGTTTTDVGAVKEKLEELVSSFRAAADEAAQFLDARLELRGVHPASGPELALTDALDVLAGLARAEMALVIDDASPEIWGVSDSGLGHVSTDDALTTARLDARLREVDLSLASILLEDDEKRRDRLTSAGIAMAEVGGLLRHLHRVADIVTEVRLPRWLRVSHAIAMARGVEGLEVVHAHVRSFAGIYRAVLVYEGPFSELHAEGALLRALPTLEKLVTSLPPRDPASGGAKVAVLRRLRRV
jgi:hypothetical protein